MVSGHGAPPRATLKKRFTVRKNSSFGAGVADGHAAKTGTTHERSDAMTMLKRYVIERDVPGIGEMSLTELCGAARASNQAIDQLGPALQWQHSYVTADKTFCVYLAESEEAIRRHAELSGAPATRITEVNSVIDPLTANN
jgi:hypothetical protein